MSHTRVAWPVLVPAMMVVAVATPARAQDITVDLPSGPLGAAAETLARQASVNIVLSDPALWQRPVPAIRGRMTLAAAVRRLARHAAATARPIGTSGWRLAPRPAALPPPSPSRPAAPIGNDMPADVVVLASKRGTPVRALAGTVEVIDLPPPGIDAGTPALVARSTLISSTVRGAGREKLFVRGLADTSFAGRLESVTGLYFGEVRLAYNGPDPDLQLYDIASVEVLPGPQGTLYGSGSIGGIIRWNPVVPRRGVASASAGAGLSATTHGAMGLDADLVLNVPVGPNVAVRTVGYARSEGGYIDKPGLGVDVNRTRIDGGRAAVRWWPGDGWTIDALAIGQAIRSSDTAFETTDAPVLTSTIGLREPFRSDYRAAHVVLGGTLGRVRLTSATGWASQALREHGAYLSYTTVDLRRRHDLFTHETRVARSGDGPAGWVAGVAFMLEVSGFRRRFGAPAAGFDRSSAGTTSEAAIFGEASVALAPFASLGAGLRLVRSDVATSAESVVDAVRSQRRQREHWLLPSASVLLRPTASLALFARYQQGRRATAAPADAEAGPPRGEVISSIEAGFKWSNASSAEMAASVQYGRWTGIQNDSFEELFGGVSLASGDSALVAANASLRWPIAPRLRLLSAVAINRSRPTGDPDTRFHVPGIADLITRAELAWTRPIGRATTIAINAWGRYEGRSNVAFGPMLFTRQGGYASSGVTVTIDAPTTQWTLSLDNPLNVRAIRSLSGSLARLGRIDTPLRPRTARLAYHRTF